LLGHSSAAPTIGLSSRTVSNPEMSRSILASSGRAQIGHRMLTEVATTDSFKDIRSTAFVDALPETDFTAKLLVENLPAAQDIFYRVRFQDLA
jgi:phosphodiesterase/alkaline phosphatase D-like protein